ncbi:MAG: PhoH family protein [Luteibaculaceae bacterium]
MPRTKKEEKIFVLDTSVILFDHNSINNFAEHDVAIPITVLEELDKFKVGNENKNFECREFIRMVDRLAKDFSLKQWVPLEGKGKGKFTIVMYNESELDATQIYSALTNDNRIINAALTLQKRETKKRVVLVTKDVNLRLKAKALGLPAEDFESGKIKDPIEKFSGKDIMEDFDAEIIKEIFGKGYSEKLESLGDKQANNHFYILKNGRSSTLAFFDAHESLIKRVEKTFAYGVKPKNAEQAFAMHAILNPDIKLVTIQGVAGTGKTLLALAGALEQKNLYQQIVLARPIVPLGNKDIGYLPGDVNDKIGPYMEPLFDNLKYIKSQFGQNEKKYKAIEEMEKEGKIIITPLAYIRGRSLSNIIFIVDEAQNLTPHEVKTIVTRAGENTKLIFTGDVNQIDTPYLDEHSNGLSYIIDRLQGQKLFSHISLEKGERSELANLANDLL